MLYTTSAEVAAAWWPHWSKASTLPIRNFVTGPWRWGLLTAYEHCYRYVEGEPWCYPSSVEADHVHCFTAPGPEVEEHSVAPECRHIRAALLCGGSADSLRRFAEAVKGALHG